jgi:uncharacterized SAM-binding protein YcdF (DUF218 family)
MIDLFKAYLRPSSPLAIVLLFGIGIIWLSWRPASRGPRRYLAVLLVGFWLATTPLGAWMLMAPLARGFAPIHSIDEASGAGAVVVLGGGARTFSDQGLVAGALSATSILRSLEGARVAKAIGAPLVVASGGVPRPDIQRKPESEMIRNVIVETGVSPESVIQESDSRTTREQARFVGDMLRARGATRFVLVTSAMHMRRSLGVFRAQGLQPIPSIAPMRSEDVVATPWWLPNSDSLTLFDESIYEYAASLYYWSRGWLVAPR